MLPASDCLLQLLAPLGHPLGRPLVSSISFISCMGGGGGFSQSTHIEILRQQSHGPGLYPFNPMSSIDRSYLLQSRIRRPVADGPLVGMFHDIGEASFNYHVSYMGLNAQYFARFQAACSRKFSGLVERVALHLGTIIGLCDGVDLALLQKAARLEVTVELMPVSLGHGLWGKGGFMLHTRDILYRG